MNKLELGKTVQNRREYLSLKQEDVAEMTGITSKTIYLIESGKGNPSIDTLTKLIEVLGLEMHIGIKHLEQ
jgi:DNA-binding XRE family transcriptional regulator